MEAPILSANGNNGQIELFSDRIRIKRKGGLAFLSHGFKGEKDILLSAITSIQFKPAGRMFSGYIQFSFIGGQENQGGLFKAAGDENTVMFTNKAQESFEQLRGTLQEMISQQRKV